MSTTMEEPRVRRISTIVTRLERHASETPERVALRTKDLGLWREITWAEYWDSVQTVGHGLLALGVEPGDRVAVHSENRPEWVYADLGTSAIRAMTMGLYPTNPPAEVGYLLADSGAVILIAEDQEQVDKALEVKNELPELKKIIYIEPRGVRNYDDPLLMSWDELLALGAEHRATEPEAVDRLMDAATTEDILSLIYTSGTTGPPKGAMLSVRNIEFAIEALVEQGGFASPPPHAGDMLLSYLPLCHVAERIFTVWFNLSAGTQVNFAESIETVQKDLQEVQPTIFLGVPRIWEKMHAGIHIRARNASLIKRLNFRFWMRIADRIADTLIAREGNHTPATRALYGLGYLFLFRSLKDRIGLRKCRFAASGAAPVGPETLRFFMGIGVPMHEVYGMTENSAVATGNRPGRVKLGTVGEPHPGTEMRIDEATGEIQSKHPGVFEGYWRDPERTKEAFTEDGWLRTGDVGEWVDGTHIKITDRLKDIVITAGGKNIAPSELENALKSSPYIKEAIVAGDARPYLTALIGIELETVGDWAERKRIAYTTYADLAEKSEVIELIQGVIDDVNHRVARAEGIKKFRMLRKELDHEDGELTATQKVRRAAIAKQFGDLVESMYP